MAEQAAEYGLSAEDVKWLRWVVQRVRGGELGLTGEGGRGERFGVLLLKGTADVIKGGNGTFNIYSGTTKGAETDTGVSVTGYCRMAAYTANTWAYGEPVDGGIEVVPECV